MTTFTQASINSTSLCAKPDLYYPGFNNPLLCVLMERRKSFGMIFCMVNVTNLPKFDLVSYIYYFFDIITVLYLGIFKVLKCYAHFHIYKNIKCKSGLRLLDLESVLLTANLLTHIYEFSYSLWLVCFWGLRTTWLCCHSNNRAAFKSDKQRVKSISFV